MLSASNLESARGWGVGARTVLLKEGENGLLPMEVILAMWNQCPKYKPTFGPSSFISRKLL